MKKIIALTACVLLFAGTAFSQNYSKAIGVRFGGYNGAIAYKQHLKQGNGFEVMVNLFWNAGFSATGLYEWSMPVINKDFNLYYGAGAHLGMYGNMFLAGIDGIVGLEYKIPNVPLAVSLDYKPSINFVPSFSSSSFYDFAFGLKYTF